MVTKESSLEVITENIFNSAAPTQFNSAAFYTFYWTTYKLVQLKVLNLKKKTQNFSYKHWKEME